jgi:proteasome accessory factor B
MNKTERQLNLVFLLMSTRRGLTRAQIRSGISDYREATSDQSFERMFERDKQELKELGFNLESFQDHYAASDEIYYRIVREDSTFHTSDLSIQQKILFQVARLQMQETVDSSRKTLIKLETLPNLDHIELSVNPKFERSSILQNIIQGIDQGRMVSFDYLSSEDENYLKRDVIPIRIIFWNRNLYLIAYSYSRQDYRTYRIDRISGDVDLGESADLDLESEATGKFKEFISNLDSSLKCLVTLKGNAVFRSVENNYIKISAVGDSVEISYPEREITDLFKVLLRNIENIQDLEPADVFTKFKQYVNRINDVQF